MYHICSRLLVVSWIFHKKVVIMWHSLFVLICYYSAYRLANIAMHYNALKCRLSGLVDTFSPLIVLRNKALLY